jgi:ribosomal protein S18 acetylase RimI-like enzyme
MEILYRAMQKGDVEDVRALCEGTEGLAFNAEETNVALARAIEKNPGLSQVAHVEGRLVGCVFIGETGLRGMINHLAVAPDYRKCGVGRQLVQNGLRVLFCTTPVRRIYASVLAENTSAQEFWSRLGMVDWTHSATAPGAKVVTFAIDLNTQSWL